jgi:hypothetical protein
VSAEKRVKENNKDAFYTEVLNALNNYLSFKLNIPVADLSRDNIERTLQRKNVNDDTRKKLMETMDTSEYARYAPGAVSGDLSKVYNDTVSLITDLEQQLNGKKVHA